MKNFDWQTTEKKFFINTKEEWKIDVMFEALNFLGNPNKKIESKVIHVAGTNGKGSTANYIKTILEKAGYNVGLFTSPHLIEYNERIYFNGRYATDEEIELCKQEILKKCKNVNDISFFEATTLIAIMLFSNYFNNKDFKPLDYFIFEVGLGGRLDATNIFLHPLASVITSISFDHMNFLGYSLDKIAYEKSGIIKEKTPVFTSNTNQEVIDVLQEVADQKHTHLYRLGRDFQLDSNLTPSLQGKHQIYNATLAKEVCKYIGIDEKYIKEGIKNTEWKGRLQEIKLKNINNNDLNIKQIYLDGAHNEDGIKVLCDFIKSKKDINTNIIGIYSVLKRKDYKNFFKFFKDNVFDKMLFYKVPEDVNDFVDCKELEEIAKENNISSCSILDFNELNKYVSKQKENIIFIFGSLYFVGFVLENYVDC